MSRYNKDLGNFGEAVAALCLEQNGCRIVERNFRCGAGELDLIAEDASCLIFVEVKTRSSCLYGQPAEAVTPRKQKRMIQTAKYYLAEHPTDKEIRFDVIEVYAALTQGEFVLKEIHQIKHAILEANE